MKNLKGSCLCGDVRFSVEDDFAKLFFCHCAQCKQITGSAYASNLFVAQSKVKWLEGVKSISHFKHDTRGFSKSFCRRCGSGLPFLSGDEQFYIVPAGSLQDAPTKPSSTQRIFCSDIVEWEKDFDLNQRFNEFPD